MGQYSRIYQKDGISGLYHALNAKGFTGTYTGIGEYIRSRMARISLNHTEPQHALLIAQANKIYQEAVQKSDIHLLFHLIENFPLGSFKEDAFLALGDIYFSQGKMEEALGVWKRLQYLDKSKTRQFLNKRIALASFLYKDLESYSRLHAYVLDDFRFHQMEKASSSPEKKSYEMPFQWLSYRGNDARNLLMQGKDMRKGKRKVQNIPLPVSLPKDSAKFFPEPLVWNNKLFYCTPAGGYCLSLARKRLLWRYEFADFVPAPKSEPPLVHTGTIHNGRLYIVYPWDATQGNRIYCFDANTGARLWQWPKETKPNTSFLYAPVIQDNNLFISAKILTGQTNVELFCLDISSSPVLRWQRFLGSILSSDILKKGKEAEPSGISLCYGLVYCCTNLGVMAAVDSHNGEIRWITKYHEHLPKEYRLKGEERKNAIVGTPPVIRNGKVYAIPLDIGHLLVYDAFSGSLVKSFPDSISESSLKNMIGVNSQDQVFLNTDREIFCLANQGQQEVLWSVTLPDLIEGTGVLTSHWIYIFTKDEYLYQISTKTGSFYRISNSPISKSLPTDCVSIITWEQQGKQNIVLSGAEISFWQIE